MKCQHLTSGRRSAGGFSLIELMISLALGLVISVAALSAYIGASGATKVTEAQSRMNEDGQAALLILTQQIRMAGYLPNPAHTGNKAMNIRGCDGVFTVADAPAADNLACNGDSSTTDADSIYINYEADTRNTVASAGMIPTDCLGNELAVITDSPPNYYFVDNRFYIDTSDNTVNLYCKGNGSDTAQPLVENIENLQLTYGVVEPLTGSMTVASNPVSGRRVAGYLNAHEFATQASLSGLTDTDRWSRVISVRICLLVRSEKPVVTDANSAKYFNCAGILTSAPDHDLRLRHTYTTTVVVRSRRV